ATALERVYYVDVARDAMLMAGLRSGEVSLARERRAVADLVDAAIRALGAATAKHEVSVEVPRDLPHVLVDPALIQRVLTSLVGNAVRHTPAGTKVRITARPEGRLVEVSVEDNGPGLPKGREEELFESFTRGESATERRGAGLGLAISRAIVEAHGGTIRSEPRGKGARIVFTLPAA
ncbi:MAG TPA: ATP-binding protein, partial [Usitatibacter sp.]|nr:ATP-binding protein [Usitatibacter sp.]